MRATIDFRFEKSEVNKFKAKCDILLRNVFTGTKQATEAACREILNESEQQVPVNTGTLLSSSYFKVRRRDDTSKNTWAYEGILGYGGQGDPVNPLSGMPTSSYMLAVHEDLSANHPNGKAKFLEDPVRDFAERNFHNVAFKYLKGPLEGK